MSTSWTTNVGLGVPAFDDRNYHTPINAGLSLLDSLGAIGPLSVRATDPGASVLLPSTTLKINVAAGSYKKADGTVASYAGASSQTLSASVTTYLWLTDGGTLTTGSSYPAATNIVRLAHVTTNGTAVTAIVDDRCPWESFGAGVGTVYLPLAGGTMTGAIVLAGAPTIDLHASTKKYVDDTFAATAGGAPSGAQYVTLATDGTLSAERVLTAGTGITLTDAGAGSTLTVAIGQTVATTANPTFVGAILTAGAAPGSAEGQVYNDSTRKAIVAITGGVTERLSGVIFSSTADGGPVANTVTETTLVGAGVGSLAMAANALATGKAVRFTAWGVFSTVGTPTLTLGVKIGTGKLAIDISYTTASSLRWQVDGVLAVRVAGASGSFYGTMTVSYGAASVSHGNASAMAFDNSASVSLDLTAQWSAADAGNTVTCKGLVVEVLG